MLQNAAELSTACKLRQCSARKDIPLPGVGCPRIWDARDTLRPFISGHRQKMPLTLLAIIFMGMSSAGYQPMDMQGIMVRATWVRATVMGQQS